MHTRSLTHARYGEPGDVIELVETPLPEPGPGEVVVSVEAAAVHIADLHNIRGRPGFRPPLPRVPGYEGVGRVVAVGDGVTAFVPGDRVFPPSGSGTFRERLVLPADVLLAAPEGDAAELALVTINGATAVVLLEDFARLGEGDWLIQNAANSNVGRYVIQLARQRGVRTVNVVRRGELADELLALGADHVLVDGPDLADRVAAATGGAAIVLGIDAVAGPATARLAACLAEGGLVANYGAMSGEPCHMGFHDMFVRDHRLCGVSMRRQMNRRSPTEQRALLQGLAELIGRGELTAAIAGRYRLDEYAEAFARADAVGAARPGKVVFVPNDAG